METGELNDDYSNYIEFLKGLPNTKIFVDVTPTSRSFNSYIGFAIPNQFTEQLSRAQENTDEIVKDDLFETLTDPENAAPLLGVKETREKIISVLQSGKQVKGTISKPFGSMTRWHITTPKGNIIEFYNKANDITAEDIASEVSLNLLPEAEFNGVKFTPIEVRAGEKFLGYVRETEDFKTPKKAVTKEVVPTKSVEEIEAEINEVIDAKGESKPEDGGVADLFFFRKGQLPANVTETTLESIMDSMYLEVFIIFSISGS
jgi:hypothetical protein